MPGYNWKSGRPRFLHSAPHPPPTAEAFSYSYPIPSLWVQLPDIHPTQVLFIKDKLPDRFIFTPVAVSLVWTRQGHQPRQTVSVRISPYCLHLRGWSDNGRKWRGHIGLERKGLMERVNQRQGMWAKGQDQHAVFKQVTYQLCHFSPEDGDNMFLRNVGIDLRNYTVT
jgi:hypothetical protein